MSRRRCGVVATLGLVLAAAVALLWPGGARAALLQDLGATFERVAQDLGARFPKVELRVAALADQEARLEGAGVGELRAGLELMAYRKGALFRHPITNQPLGHAEEEVATLVVTAVAADHATARIAVTEAGRALVAGDSARITAGRIPVVVVPLLGVQVPGETADQTALLLVARLSALLEKTGRFLTVEAQRVLEVTGIPPAAPPPPQELARTLRVAAVLSARVVQEGRARVLETTWVSGRTGATLVSLRTPFVRAVYPPRFAWEQTPELARRLPVGGPVRGVAVADVDGDGRPELVVGDDRALRIYQWRDSEGLVPLEGGTQALAGLILSVDAAPLEGAGRAQIVVVTHGGGLVTSTVLGYADGRLTPRYATQGRYLRVVSVGTERWLLEQRVGQVEPFDPLVRRLVVENGRYQDGPALTVPNGVSVYGLALIRLTGAAEPEIVALMPEDRITVWTHRGQRLWSSADPYGGSAVTFPFTPTFERRQQTGPGPIVGRIPGRLLALPSEAGGPDLLVFENLLPALDRFRTLLPQLAPVAFTSGRIHRLRWRDGGFLRVWSSAPTEGYIADFTHGDLDGDEVPEVVVGVVAREVGLDTLNPFGRPAAHLVLYELP